MDRVLATASSVPPPAAADHPWRDAMVAALFVLALVIPLIGGVLKRDLAHTRFENRPTAPWPSVAFGAPVADGPREGQATAGWRRAFEAAFNDRFGGRDRLIAYHHLALAVGLGVAPVPKVMIGRNGWLFFKGEDQRAIDRDFRGVVPYPADEGVRIAAELQRRHDLLAARGIPYVVLVAPDKATIYPEYLPRWVKRAPHTRLDRLFAALADHPELHVIDPRAKLRAAKPGGQVYYRTDSHWNYGGTTIAYDLLMSAVRSVVPRVPHVPAEPAPYEPGDTYSGDLANLLGLPRWFEEIDRLPFRKILGDATRRCARPIRDPVEPVVQGCPRDGLPRALVYRDSMFDAMIPAVSENFSRVVYFAGHHMTMADIDRERPDVVIEEFVERTMHALLVDPVVR
ncbi:MAG: hypothetical protein ABIS17_03110 [Casimicrobiaceae bacterium]